MRSFLLALLCAFAAFASTTNAFAPAIHSGVAQQRTAVTGGISSSTSLNVFGKKKSAAAKAAEEEREAQFWQGEWVCKDCGYIYNRVSRGILIYSFVFFIGCRVALQVIGVDVVQWILHGLD